MSNVWPACQRHVDLKKLDVFKCCKTTRGLSTWALFQFCSLFGSLCVCVCVHCSPFSLAHAHAALLRHSVWRTWSAALEICFFASGQKEKRVGGVENVFWQVSLMRSYYEICKPPCFSTTAPPPPLSTRRNCNRAECKSGRAYGADELYRWLCDQCLYRVQTYTHIYANIQRKGRQGRRDLVKDVINLHRRTLAMAIWTNYKINSATYWME